MKRTPNILAALSLALVLLAPSAFAKGSHSSGGHSSKSHSSSPKVGKPKTVVVRPYVKKNGKVVQGHTRSKPTQKP